MSIARLFERFFGSNKECPKSDRELGAATCHTEDGSSELSPDLQRILDQTNADCDRLGKKLAELMDNAQRGIEECRDLSKSIEGTMANADRVAEEMNATVRRIEEEQERHNNMLIDMISYLKGLRGETEE